MARLPYPKGIAKAYNKVFQYRSGTWYPYAIKGIPKVATQTTRINLWEVMKMFGKMLKNYLHMVNENSERYFENKSQTVSAFYLMID